MANDKYLHIQYDRSFPCVDYFHTGKKEDTLFCIFHSDTDADFENLSGGDGFCFGNHDRDRNRDRGRDLDCDVFRR